MERVDQHPTIQTLRTIAPPYLHLLTAARIEVNRICSVAGFGGLVARHLRARRMTTVHGLWDEFAAAFQFPWYFGYNWAAFDECLSDDMDWLPLTGYVIGIMDAEALLTEEQSRLRVFIEIVQDAGETYRQPMVRGDSTDRLALPFHAVFQAEESQMAQLRERLLAAGAMLDDILPLPPIRKRPLPLDLGAASVP